MHRSISTSKKNKPNKESLRIHRAGLSLTYNFKADKVATAVMAEEQVSFKIFKVTIEDEAVRQLNAAKQKENKTSQDRSQDRSVTARQSSKRNAVRRCRITKNTAKVHVT